jgi:hypothetical protein
MVKRSRIVDREVDLQHVSAINQMPALHHMKLFGVRCAVIIDDGSRIQPNRNQFIKPSWFGESVGRYQGDSLITEQ